MESETLEAHSQYLFEKFVVAVLPTLTATEQGPSEYFAQRACTIASAAVEELNRYSFDADGKAHRSSEDAPLDPMVQQDLPLGTNKS